MIRFLYFFILITALPYAITAETHRHGEIRFAEKTEAWDEHFNEWVTPEEFWGNYTLPRGGVTWGVGRVYPPYREVKEHDTFMIKLDTGLCLMEFFHTRWRRANDVWRWDPAFNDYAGCSRVFE